MVGGCISEAGCHNGGLQAGLCRLRQSMSIRKTIVVVVGMTLLGVIGAGIYRFNFTNDDIFVKNPNGTVVSYGKPIKAGNAVPKSASENS